MCLELRLAAALFSAWGFYCGNSKESSLGFRSLCSLFNTEIYFQGLNGFV